MDFDGALKELGLMTGWRLVPFLGVRTGMLAVRNAEGQCPLEALAGVEAHMLATAMDTLEQRGLPYLDSIRIACAADAARAPYEMEDRHALLVACGLESTECSK